MDDGQRELMNERAAAKKYADMIIDLASLPVYIEANRNNLWTQTGLPVKPSTPPTELLGRVGLDHESIDLDGANNFYIGHRHVTLGDIEVFSWQARVASSFFRRPGEHPFHDRVAVTRTFDYSGRVLTFYQDEFFADVVSEDVFRSQELQIAAPARKRELPKGPAPAAEIDTSTRPTTVEDELHLSDSPALRPVARPTPARTAPIRADKILRARLAAPRQRQLSSVLSTLQPEQYDLVARPANVDLVIQGQPGTGKTIVAIHRAVYLTGFETETEHRATGDVMLIGPSVDYSFHVRGIVMLSSLDRPFMLCRYLN